MNFFSKRTIIASVDYKNSILGTKVLYVLKISDCTVFICVADPDPGSGTFLTSGSGIQDPGWVKYQDPDLG